MARLNRKYRISAIYDTETTTINTRREIDGILVDYPLAYPVLFIANRLADDVAKYVAEVSDDIRYYRYGSEFLEFIEEIIREAEGQYIPVVCAYNLMFDMQPIWYVIKQKYPMSINAQSSKNIYTIDLLDDDGNGLLRFWDVSHLEPRGLKYMGEAAGLEKAIGDWDYSLIRTPETPLTDQELHYAARDVQVIPAYLRYLLESNLFLDPEDLGCSLITKTSLVRLMAKRITGQQTVQCKKGPKSLELLMRLTCRAEAPKDYDTYARRKACFRGGLTFTAANYAGLLESNVVSVDAVSMHHAHINGAQAWYKFKKLNPQTLYRQLQIIGSTDLDTILSRYERPFKWAVHAHVRIYGLCLKPGSLFEQAGIATLAEAKCSGGVGYNCYEDPRGEAASKAIIRRGYTDKASGTPEQPRVYAYSKLMSAAVAEVYVSELEWWILCQVYAFDSFEVLDGESTSSAGRAPEYITLLSNMLYNQKDELKQILKNYEQGKPYPLENTSLPGHIAEAIESGSASRDYLESFYKHIIKGSYNAIYGSQAQDVYKPQFMAADDGEIKIDENTVASPDNFAGASGAGLVLYTYGLRIVGRSRMHLIIAMLLLHQAYGNRIAILGGDTDSLKIATDPDITDEMIIAALEPLHAATRNAIQYCQQGIRKNYPKYASPLEKLGEFEVEAYSGGKYSRYKHHIELWNKCRLSVDQDDKVHITCAGISRPSNQYNLEDLATDMLRKYGLSILTHIIGYNTYYDSTISYLLQHNNPAPGDRFCSKVVDYLGNKATVSAYQSIALKPAGKVLGDTDTLGNKENILYKHERGENPDTRGTHIFIDDKKAYIEVDYMGVSPILYEVNRSKL